ncbi:MAG: SDR family oxidoreductase, partial [Bdellovibrio sp.]|nr:SDR family oxidoreductase [Bdellovibrio sp.]
ADYTAPETLEIALRNVDKLMMISGSEVGQRVSQHANILSAAKKTNVKFIAYTSILNADKSKMMLATEHLATERMIQESGIQHAFLRNSWYIENYTGQLKNVIASGGIAGAAKNGNISAATRQDYAAAAVTVLLGGAKNNPTYELGGEAFTMQELAAVISRVSGKKVEYQDMPAGEYAQLLLSFGLPKPVAEMLSDSDVGISRGDLYTTSDDLKKLLGRSPTSLEETIKKALQGI